MRPSVARDVALAKRARREDQDVIPASEARSWRSPDTMTGAPLAAAQDRNLSSEASAQTGGSRYSGASTTSEFMTRSETNDSKSRSTCLALSSAPTSRYSARIGAERTSELPSVPCREHSTRKTAKEEPGNHDVRIEDNFHLRLRTRRTARSTSDFLRRADRAALRARPTMSSN